MLDTLVSPEELSRRYFATVRWEYAELLAFMNDGSGNDYSIVFAPNGVFIRGFDHESEMSPARTDELWPGLVDGVPPSLVDLTENELFTYEGVLSATYCIWREAHDSQWRVGEIEYPELDGRDDVDGSRQLETLCDGTPDTYLRFATTHYGRPIDRDLAMRVWALEPLTDELVAGLRPGAAATNLREEASIIGYPCSVGE